MPTGSPQDVKKRFGGLGGTLSREDRRDHRDAVSPGSPHGSQPLRGDPTDREDRDSHGLDDFREGFDPLGWAVSPLGRCIVHRTEDDEVRVIALGGAGFFNAVDRRADE